MHVTYIYKNRNMILPDFLNVKVKEQSKDIKHKY